MHRRIHIYGARGGWTDLDTGEEYTEDTVVVVLIGANAEEARTLAEKAGRLLDQKSVLVAGSASSTEYIEPQRGAQSARLPKGVMRHHQDAP